MREARYDVLFEPIDIGPVTARNRFFQVPHCNGMGYRDPTAEAFMRRVVNAATGELLRDLVLDPNRDYQPTR